MYASGRHPTASGCQCASDRGAHALVIAIVETWLCLRKWCISSSFSVTDPLSPLTSPKHRQTTCSPKQRAVPCQPSLVCVASVVCRESLGPHIVRGGEQNREVMALAFVQVPWSSGLGCGAVFQSWNSLVKGPLVVRRSAHVSLRPPGRLLRGLYFPSPWMPERVV